ncbi:MAG TPA: protein kinase [Candidatus Xenobia bacterium]|jgi:hypothetical protein
MGNGLVILERFPVGRAVGEGALWRVFESRDVHSGERVVLKLMQPGLAADAELSRRILKQAESTVPLVHPNVARVYAVGVQGGVPYLIQEYVDGRNLRHWYAEDGRSFHDLKDKLMVVLSTLQAAHEKNLLHRGLKPENIFVTGPGEVKITDFEQASRLELDTHLAAMGGPAAVAYVAPEQALGRRGDVRSDLYSLGVVLYELLCGRLPFWDSDPVRTVYRHVHDTPVALRQVNSRVPHWFEAVVMKLLSKEPEQRFQTAAQVAGEVGQVGPAPVRALHPLELALGARRGLQEAPLLGRDAERDQLRAALEAAQAGGGSLVLVEGEAGVGTTRLVKDLAIDARNAGMVVLQTDSGRGHQPPLLAPFVDALGEHLRGHGHTVRDLVGAEDGAILERLLEDHSLPPVGAGLLSRVTQAMQRLFGILAERHGLMVAVDDMGSLDEGSLKFIEVLLPWLTGQRLLLVGTCQPAEFKFSPRGRRTPMRLIGSAVGLRVHLEPLLPESVGDLVRSMTATRAVDPAVVAAIHRQSRGQPFLVEEILQLLWRDRAVEVKDEVLTVKAETTLDSLTALQDPLGYRLRSLPEKAAGVLGTAACVGRTFDFEVLTKVAGVESDEIISVLRWACQAGLIAEVGSSRERFSFTHPLLQARLYVVVEPRRRRRLHLLIGAAIEELFEARLYVYYPRLIFHYRESQQWKKALEFALRAADFYEELQLFESTTRSLELGLTALSRAPDQDMATRVVRRLARMYQMLGRTADARTLREALNRPKESE